MLVSTGFALLLLVVVALFYLKPRRRHCPGCGARRADEAPLCSSCGWIYDVPDDDDEEDEMEPELSLDEWQEGR